MLSGNSAICHRPFGFSCSISIAPNFPTERKGATELTRRSATLRPLFLEFVWATLAVGCLSSGDVSIESESLRSGPDVLRCHRLRRRVLPYTWTHFRGSHGAADFARRMHAGNAESSVGRQFHCTR